MRSSVLFGGLTPQAFHQKHAFPGQHCQGCAGPAAIRAIVMVPYDEAVKRQLVPPGHEASQQVLDRTVMLRGSDGKAEPYVRLSVTYCCTLCQRDFEKALAQAPSWAVVELNRGPDPTNRVQIQA